MPKPRNKFIKDQQVIPSEAFVTWKDNDPDSFKVAQGEIAKAYKSINPLIRSTASKEISVRRGMEREDYEAFRPYEAVPEKREKILSSCMWAYEKVSPIGNIFDMMADFTVEGIKIVHPNKVIEKFFKGWFEMVGGYDRSHHFINNFYLLGTAIARKKMGKVSDKVYDDIQRGLALVGAKASDVFDVQLTPAPKYAKNVVPCEYEFLDPRQTVLLSNILSAFGGQKRYGYTISNELFNLIKNPRSVYDTEAVRNLPKYVTDAVTAGLKVVPLDEDRLSVFHYKKNDWCDWSKPILYRVMDDIILLQKMKMTDLAALDGAISHVRIWGLGSLDHKVMPTEAAFEKLAEVLENAGNGQSLDLMWGPDLTLKETTSDIYKYLGQEKYVPVLSSLYSGLGIPPTLVGGAGGEKGFTNNSLSLRTLIERLNYGREILIRFWENEIRIVQQAMQFRFPAQIEFKNSILNDEASFNSLLIDLLDRDVISVERIRDHLGYIPEIEESMVKSEWKARETGKIPPKASPFHNAEKQHDLKKSFIPTGIVTPSEVGLELEENKKGEKIPLKLKMELTPKQDISSPADKKGQQGEGRPRNSLDTKPRQTRRITPRTATEEEPESTFVDLAIWAKDAQQRIGEIVNPVFLAMNNKKNVRSLTLSQVEDLELIKFNLLCNLDPYQEINDNIIKSMLDKPLNSYTEANNYWKILVSNYVKNKGSNPTIEDIRQIQSYVYAYFKGN